MKRFLITLVLSLPFLTSAQVYDVTTHYLNDWYSSSNIKISTKIELVGVQMPKVQISGYNDANNTSMIIDVSWHSEDENFVSANSSSSGGYAPEVYISGENSMVQINLRGDFYFTRFTITAFSEGLDENPDYFLDWEILDEDHDWNNYIQAFYNNHFRDHVSVDGNLSAGTISASQVVSNYGFFSTLSTNSFSVTNLNVGTLNSGVIYSTSINTSGKVGIGISSPREQLQVNGNVGIFGNNKGYKFNSYFNSTNKYLSTGYGAALILDADGKLLYSNTAVSGFTDATATLNNVFAIDKNGKVGIGTISPNINAQLDVVGNIFSSNKIAIGTNDMAKIGNYSLAVNGDAIFNKARVKLYNTWPDYVFDLEYPLLSLPELEKYIKANNHLPGVKSAREVERDGLDLGSNQAALLEKIEELTLYIIEQNKKLVDLQDQINGLKSAGKK